MIILKVVNAKWHPTQSWNNGLFAIHHEEEFDFCLWKIEDGLLLRHEDGTPRLSYTGKINNPHLKETDLIVQLEEQYLDDIKQLTT